MPIDIAHKSFDKKMWGLDADQVMEYMQLLATQMEEIIQDRNFLKDQMREKELAILEYKDREQVLKSTVTAATQMTEKMRSDAEREARLIITDAQQKSEIITRDSRDSLKKIYQEINDLKRMRMQFEANLKALAQAHLSLLEQGEKYMPQAHLPNYNMTQG